MAQRERRAAAAWMGPGVTTKADHRGLTVFRLSALLATLWVASVLFGATGAFAHQNDAHSPSSIAAEEILPTPIVQSTKLQNIVNNLYKGTTNLLRVGDGTTMSAIRSELETGQPTNGAWHLTKGANEYQGLTNWLARNPNGAYSDRLVAQSLVDEIEAAFRSGGGFPW